MLSADQMDLPMLSAFIPDPAVIAAFVLASLVLGITPGPDMAYFLSRTVAQSRAAGFAALGGISLGLAIHSLLVAVGLSVLLAVSAVAFTVLKVAGAIYLAWLAIGAVRGGSSLSLDRHAVAEPLGRVFLKGVLVNLLNPKIIVFFLTFLPQFVSAADPHASGKLLFFGVLFMAANLPLCALLVWFADRIAGLLRRSARLTRLIDWLFAGVLAAFAVRLLLARPS